MTCWFTISSSTSERSVTNHVCHQLYQHQVTLRWGRSSEYDIRCSCFGRRKFPLRCFRSALQWRKLLTVRAVFSGRHHRITRDAEQFRRAGLSS